MFRLFQELLFQDVPSMLIHEHVLLGKVTVFSPKDGTKIGTTYPEV